MTLAMAMLCAILALEKGSWDCHKFWGWILWQCLLLFRAEESIYKPTYVRVSACKLACFQNIWKLMSSKPPFLSEKKQTFNAMRYLFSRLMDPRKRLSSGKKYTWKRWSSGFEWWFNSTNMLYLSLCEASKK